MELLDVVVKLLHLVHVLDHLAVQPELVSALAVEIVGVLVFGVLHLVVLVLQLTHVVRVLISTALLFLLKLLHETRDTVSDAVDS